MSWKFTRKLTAITQDLSQDLNPPLLDYTIWGIIENKTNTTSHQSIESLKTAIEEEGNKMFEEFFLKAFKSFRGCVDTIIQKMAAHLSKFSVLCLSSYFVVSF